MIAIQIFFKLNADGQNIIIKMLCRERGGEKKNT